MHRHLGIILSSNLQWGAHAQDMSKSTRRAGLLRWLANDQPSHVAEEIYLYSVQPCMEYASPVWNGSLQESDADALEMIQAGVGLAC